jgi:SAM-dependent methyltransferase
MLDSLTQKLTKSRVRAFVTSHASQGLTLDLGCGNSPYASLFPNRVGLDQSPGRGVAALGDMHELPFGSAAFENVLCTEALEHSPNPQAVADEMRRVLRPGGVVILTTRFLYPIHEAPGDFWRFTKYGLRYLFRDWDLLACEEEADTFESFAILCQRLGFQGEFRGLRQGRYLFFLLAKVVARFPRLIAREYGNTVTGFSDGKTTFPSGYHVLVRKKAFHE